MSSSQEKTTVSTTADNARRRSSSARDGRTSRVSRSSRSESVRAIVRRDALRGVINSGLRQQRFLGRVTHYVPVLAHRGVRVEANKNCMASSVFYVPQRRGLTASRIKKVKPNAEHVVRRNDEFFISFIGMSIASYDNQTGFSVHKSDNELLLYSMQCLTRTQGLKHVPKEVEEELGRQSASRQNQNAPRQSASNQNQDAPTQSVSRQNQDAPTQSVSVQNQVAPTQSASRQNQDAEVVSDPSPNEGGNETRGAATGAAPGAVPQTAQNARVDTGYASMFGSEDDVYIHYDPVVDARNSGTMADTFVTIPATKRIYACSEHLPLSIEDDGDEDHDGNDNHGCPCLESLFMRFTVMEIDKISDLQARAVIGVDHFGSFVSGSAGSIPYIQLLTKAFAVASSAGKYGLKKYSRPDHVITVDREFFLANPVKDGEVKTDKDKASEENYLQYGYYFFLSKPVQAKLYANTEVADENIPLMMKRTDLRPGRQECEYIPLTENSYVVMKVSRGCCKLSHDDKKRRSEGHKLRLDNLISMSSAIEVLAEAERNRGSLLPRM